MKRYSEGFKYSWMKVTTPSQLGYICGGAWLFLVGGMICLEPKNQFVTLERKESWDKCQLVLVSRTIAGDKPRDEKRFVRTNDSTSHCEMILAPGPSSFLKWRIRSMGSFLKILQNSPHNSYHRIINDVSKLKFLICRLISWETLLYTLVSFLIQT